MKNYKLTALLLVIAFSLGAFLGPKKTEIKEVEKIVYKERVESKKDIKTVTKKKETIKPDGSKTIETVTESDSSTKTNTDKSQQNDKSYQSTITNRPEWHVIGMYEPSIQMYGLGIQRRILGEIYVGGYIKQDRTYGISIGVGF